MEDIVINHKGLMYFIEKEPFETHDDAYSRGWFIINNKNVCSNTNQLISMSIINNCKKKGMDYNI